MRERGKWPQRSDNPLPPCGGGLGRGDAAACEMRDDDLVDTLDIAEHLVVPKPQDTESLSLQPSCSRIVLSGATIMLPAINLDDEPPGEADEIDDVRSNRDLPSKAMAADLLESKL